MAEEVTTPDQAAALAKLRDARAELEESIRQRKIAERQPAVSTPGPPPAPPLGQQVQMLRDQVDALERRVDRAAAVVQELIREFRAAGLKPKLKPKAADNGKAQPPARK